MSRSPSTPDCQEHNWFSVNAQGKPAVWRCRDCGKEINPPPATPDEQSLPSSKEAWKGPYVQPNQSGECATSKDEMIADIANAIGIVESHVWKARFTLYVIKPLLFLYGIALCAAGLYGGTWIVVLALKHSGAIR